MPDRAMFEAMVRDVVNRLDADRGEGQALPFLDAVEVELNPRHMEFIVHFTMSDGRRFDQRFHDHWNMEVRLGRHPDDIFLAIRLMEEMYLEHGARAMRPRLRFAADDLIPVEMAYEEPADIVWRRNAQNYRNARQRREDEQAQARRWAVQRNQRLRDDLWAREVAGHWRNAFDLGGMGDIVQVRTFDKPRHPEASKRGRRLLLSNLSPEQRQSYETEGYFDVIGGTTGKQYRLFHGTHLNILIVKDQRGMCVIPKESMVYGDVLLSQKLALELEENAAIVEAHFFPIHPGVLRDWAEGAKASQLIAMTTDS